MAKDTGYKLISQNKSAYYNYFIEDTYQAGIVLVGTEVKSLRTGRSNINEGFVRIENNEAYIINMYISPYEHGNIHNKDPRRQRKLLLHKREIRKLYLATSRDGYTIVPLKVYLSGSLVKIDIGIGKGKKVYDKRQDIAKKDQLREAEKSFKVRNLNL